MRKWVVIGVLGFAGMAFVFVLTRPEEGTIEWHKRQYVTAWNVSEENTWRDRLKRIFNRVRNTRPADAATEGSVLDAWEQMASNEIALVNLRYLRQGQLALSNRTPIEVIVTFTRAFGTKDPFVSLYRSHNMTNGVTLTAPTERFSNFVRFIREADVP